MNFYKLVTQNSVHNLKSVALTLLKLLAFNGQKFRELRDPGDTPFSKVLRGEI